MSAPDVTFLATAAQILPVIFVALIVQQVFPSISRHEAERIVEDRVMGERDAERTRAAVNALEASIERGDKSEDDAALEKLRASIDAELARRKASADQLVTYDRRRAATVSLVVMFWMVCGEAAALVGVDARDPSVFRSGLAGSAIAAGGALLLYPLFLGQLERLCPDGTLSRRLFWAWMAAGLSVLGAYLIALID